MDQLEGRWVIMCNEDEGATFTHAVLDRRRNGTHNVRFGVRSIKDAHILVEALTFFETMEHGYMPALLVEIETPPKRVAKKPVRKARPKS